MNHILGWYPHEVMEAEALRSGKVEIDGETWQEVVQLVKELAGIDNWTTPSHVRQMTNRAQQILDKLEV